MACKLRETSASAISKMVQITMCDVARVRGCNSGPPICELVRICLPPCVPWMLLLQTLCAEACRAFMDMYVYMYIHCIVYLHVNIIFDT